MAGNVITPEVIASIEFAATQFKTALCVVMGHSKCGAMNAAKDILGGKAEAPTPSLHELIETIRTPYKMTQSAIREIAEHQHCHENDIDFTSTLTHFNVQHGVEAILKRSEVLSGLASKGEFATVGAYYDLHSGKVTFLPEGDHKRLIQAMDKGELALRKNV
jgi:carbonic anhydrase